MPDHVRDKIQKLGHISDGAFPPSILKLSVNAFAALVEGCLGDDLKTAKQVLIEAGAPDTSLSDILNEAAMKFANRVTSGAGKEAMKDVSSFFGAKMDGVMERFGGVAGELYGGGE